MRDATSSAAAIEVEGRRGGGDRSVVWTSDDEFTVGGTRFRIVDLDDATSDGLPIFKTREMVEAFVALVGAYAGARIVELGIWAGGSTALLAQLLRPSKLVAVDIASGPATRLEAIIDREGLRDGVRLYYGVDQADRGRLSSVVADEFGDDQLDLVIDDASHLLTPTRASFETVFPRLRRDGLFVIEDWAWEHAMAAKLADALHQRSGTDGSVGRSELMQMFKALGTNDQHLASLRTGVFLSDLVSEIVVAKADGDPTIGEITVQPAYTAVRRGPSVALESGLPGLDGRLAAPRVLHLGPVDDRTLSEMAGRHVRELVLVTEEPLGRTVPTGTEVIHVAVDPSRAPVAEIVGELADAPLDLVIDACSPDAERARVLASALLNHVPPGGAYLVGGWHRMIAAESQTVTGSPGRRVPRLLLELLLSVAEWGGAIERLVLGEKWLTICRGDTALAAHPFDITHLYHDHLESLSRA